MFRGLYNWTLSLAAKPAAERWLAGISFAESSFFPIPPDVVLMPMVLANRARAFRIAAICTIASVLGGIAGYLIGAFLWEVVGQPIIGFYGYEHKFEGFQARFIEWGVLTVLIAGFTPVPFKVITIASGVFAFNPVLFIVSAVVARAARFFLVAGLLWRFGPPIRGFIEKRLNLLATLFMILLVGGFVAIKYL